MIGRPVAPEQTDAYQEWHHRIDIAVRAVGGFVASELHPPIDGMQKEWIHVLRFDSGESLQGWLEAPERQALVKEADAAFGSDVHQQVFHGRASALPITVALTHKVRPGCEDGYRSWLAGLDRAAACFPGFLGSERHDPVPGIQDDFLVVFRFESHAHLMGWRESAERGRFMERREEFVETTRERRMTGGFDTWFSAAETVTSGRVPRRWKQAIVVLLGLYPTSMLLGFFVFPRIPGWPDPLARLAGFALSIGTLTWVVMPVLTNLLAGWLDPAREETPLRIAGAVCGVLAACAAYVALFSMVL